MDQRCDPFVPPHRRSEFDAVGQLKDCVCGVHLPPQAKFCFECGEKQPEASQSVNISRPVPSAMASPGLRRMMRELRLVQSDPSWGVSAAPVSDEDLFVWHCNVAGHPPGGGAPVILHLELTFPSDYPTRPPKLEVLGSTVRHPNVFSTFICLDMLEAGEWAADEEKQRPHCGWSSAYSILAILRQLQTFFFEGDGTQWWDCPMCTLRNPISKRRCDACDQSRGQIRELVIDVNHHDGFRCRCGHAHNTSEIWPPFPDPLNCDDAPLVVELPDHPDDVCVICLGHFEDAPPDGPLRGALGARPLAQLLDNEGSIVCGHWFHLPCVQQLQTKNCPMCRQEFSSIVERKRETDVSPAVLKKGASTEVRCEALRSRARNRMAHLADWHSGIVVKIMACLRRPERATLGSAIPVWRDAALAPIFWEAQELQCFHEKTGPYDDTIGVGVNAVGRGKLAKLTAHFDAVSLTAWRGGLRRAAWKEPITHWIPLFINSQHAAESATIMVECLELLADCAPHGSDSHLPSTACAYLVNAGAPQEAVHAMNVLPELMHQLLKQVLDGDRHASTKLLKGYFVLHRLFLHFCDVWPVIRDAADAAIRIFAESSEQRTKTATPWIAYILQLLTISNVGWDEVKDQFVEECLARNIQFTRVAFPNYRPVDPDAEEAKTQAFDEVDAFSEWMLYEDVHGSDAAGTVGAQQLHRGWWSGRPKGWSCLGAAFRAANGRHSFSVRVRKLPKDGVIRIGWSTEEDCTPFNGWCYYASDGSFGESGWFSRPSEGNARSCFWVPYGTCFSEGDVLTACFDHGIVSFLCNGVHLGTATRAVGTAEMRPLVAMKRGAEVELLLEDSESESVFHTPEQLRNMAWEARLNRRGNTLVLFQAFFLSLVRPRARSDGTCDWESLKNEYDRRFGFPSPKMSSALMGHFGEVHRIISLRGSEGWPLYFELLGFPRPTNKELDRLLFAAYQRATALGYKMGGRRDHA
jgi:ubiquitin-protein ligase